MSRFFRENAKLIVVAAVAIMLGLTAPAIGHGVHAQFAHNADKVDGKHAVGAGTSVANRQGKLVATDSDGRLPNNIIKTAPNSARLGGFTHAQMASMPLLVQGAGVTGNATRTSEGVTLSGTGTGEMRFGFIVPPGHKEGTGLRADIVYMEHSSGACSWHVSTSGLVGPNDAGGDDLSHNGAWSIPGSTGWDGTITVPSGGSNTFRTTFGWPFTDAPGKYVQFALQRNGDNQADTCGQVQVMGVQIRF